MAHTLRTTTRDGKMFYIIGSNSLSDAHIILCNTIAERNAIAAEADGFVLVKAAFRDDPTVHRGWAMYVKEVTGSDVGWIKVAEEESVEGIWGINEELLKQFVTWQNFTTHINQQSRKNAKYEAYQETIDYVKRLVHEHTNLNILHLIGDNHGSLTYNNKIVGGTYVYDAVEEYDDPDHEGEKLTRLSWRDPTLTNPTPIPVDTTKDIADRFAFTSLAFSGQILMVNELDGSISCYFIYKDGSNYLTKFIGSYGGDLEGKSRNVMFTEELPTPSAKYTTKEYFYLLPPGRCGNTVGHFYECRFQSGRYSWYDVTEGSLAQLQGVTGSSITTCFRKDWNTVSITWWDPLSLITREDDDNPIVTWKRTYLVRKFGSKPLDKDDGVIVKVSEYRNECREVPFIDVCPISSEKVYYAVFTESCSGAFYSDDEKYFSEAVFPDWEYIRDVFFNKHLTKMFSVGDVIVSPRNTVTGKSIDFKIISLTTTKMTLAAMHKIGDLPLDGVEYGMTPTEDMTWVDGKKYYQSTVDEDSGELTFDEYDGEHYDTPVHLELFEAPYNPNYDATNKVAHGSNDWENTNLYRWLNNKSANWFNGVNSFDRNGLCYTSGFLYGFQSEPDFLALIDRVTLPSEDNGALEVIKDKTGSIWAEGSDSPNNFFGSSFYNGSFATMLEHPENKCAVYPVIELVQA